MSTTLRNITYSRLVIIIVVIRRYCVIWDFEHVRRKCSMAIINAINSSTLELVLPFDNSGPPTNHPSFGLRKIEIAEHHTGIAYIHFSRPNGLILHVAALSIQKASRGQSAGCALHTILFI